MFTMFVRFKASTAEGEIGEFKLLIKRYNTLMFNTF